ncbi:DUF397 domain-containing protein [Streptomyces sp. NPDC006658]|jgi:hypothetical protein|uniref:DUF397 domain-containing protein n=1 Tax=unclassified Streptomyces TaxID=2593676 RepID=UPI002965FA6A|nr:DUF397 domain-containing protein [Streptomyces sp. SCL15-4]
MQNYSNGVSAASIEAAWVKSRKSSANGQCVELTRLPDGRVAVRNSTDPTGPALIFKNAEFEAFVHGAKNQEFDHLIDG